MLFQSPQEYTRNRFVTQRKSEGLDQPCNLTRSPAKPALLPHIKCPKPENVTDCKKLAACSWMVCQVFRPLVLLGHKRNILM